MDSKFIKDQDGINLLLERLNKANILALDTEFDRRNTYFPKLSLIQLAFNSEIYVIDALTTDFKALLTKIIGPKYIKIIHSGRQDLEIFYNLLQKLPSNIFDTQIAAKLCGYGSSISYGELCNKICNVTIDKKYQSANWLLRDISHEMLEYAMLDVKHLEQIYFYLNQIITRKKLNPIFMEEMTKLLLNESLYKSKAEDSWKKVKFSKRNSYFLEKMKIIASFREESARTLNIPRGFFATDRQLIEICNILPIDLNKLNQVKNLRPWIKSLEYRERLFKICNILRDQTQNILED